MYVKENNNTPYRTILMGFCSCSRDQTEQRYVENKGDVDIRRCDECGALNEWQAYIKTSAYKGDPGL